MFCGLTCVIFFFLQAVNSGSNLHVSYGCVSVVSNIFYFITPEMLVDLLHDINISR